MGMAAHGFDGATPSELKPFSPTSNNNMDTTVGPPPHVQPVHYQDSPNHVSFTFEVFYVFLAILPLLTDLVLLYLVQGQR